MDIYDSVLRQIERIEDRMNVISQDMLGRTLAYNTFLPRLTDKDSLYRHLKDNTKRALMLDIDSFLHLTKDSVIKDNSGLDVICAFLHDTNNSDIDSIADCIGMLRHFMPVFVGYGGMILSTYQILELAVFGADMFILDTAIIDIYTDIMLHANSVDSIHSKESTTNSIVNKLITFALNVGLIPIFRLNADNESIFLQHHALLDCVLLDSDIALPKEKDFIIFSERDNGADIVIETIQ